MMVCSLLLRLIEPERKIIHEIFSRIPGPATDVNQRPG